MKKISILTPALIGALVLTSCGGEKTSEKMHKVPAIDLTALDTTARPQDDFYQYCNGNWMKNNPLKPEYSRFGSFDLLRDSAQERIHSIVEELSAKESKKGSNEYRVGTLYRQAMDSAQRNKLGVEPIKPELQEIQDLKTKEDIIKYASKKDKMYGSALFTSYVSADLVNSDMNVFNLAQTGLGLGSKDYYVENTPEMKSIREGYVKYVQKIAQLAGYDASAIDRIAKNNLKVETELAQISYSSTELRDTYKNYHMLKVKKFVDENKGFDWKGYFEGRDLGSLDSMNVSQLDYFTKFDKWFAKANIEEIKDWMVAQEINDAASALSDDFQKAQFEFFGKKLSGKMEMKARWKRSVDVVDGLLPEALGEIYVKKYFPKEAKDKMLKLVKNLQTALGERIKGLSWMGSETKQKALEKLNSFVIKIGYPDKWKDYSKLEIDENKSYYENLLSARSFEHQDNMSRLGKKVDRTEWQMAPQTVNAYYNPTTNEICFPAGILQPPFFNMDADDAVNYGAIGVVIGHEMTHGFDDQGRNFDKNGNLNDWWTEDDSKKFNEASKKLADQYSEILVADGVHANGELTLGENIADQGGLLISYMAFKNASKDTKADPIDGFTPDQRFFIAYARLWGQNIRPEEILRLTKMDVHSLGKWRVNQALKNIDPFYEAFSIKPEDKMYLAPEKRVVVW
ncbi:M13 family metallopeptidase [Porphyromonas pogonae]|uniref:M13 family metallopeptidase n=1 Tax=Porphyromonas pogonae TaxID=867595 RepID=UPI002E77FEA3|nr:M13 family metallopeptidase [Porphyromonas pogonae]